MCCAWCSLSLLPVLLKPMRLSVRVRLSVCVMWCVVFACNAVLLNPMRLSEKAKRAVGAAAFEARYDALIDQFGSDMNIYARMVCDTVVTTVPKAIVHCMVRGGMGVWQ